MLAVVKVVLKEWEGGFFADESKCDREAGVIEMELSRVSSVGCDGSVDGALMVGLEAACSR